MHSRPLMFAQIADGIEVAGQQVRAGHGDVGQGRLEWVIIRAIAYSGLPDWRNVLRWVAPRMPGRRVMIDSYLAGKLPTLTDIPLEEVKPGMMDKLRGTFTKNPFAKDERK